MVPNFLSVAEIPYRPLVVYSVCFGMYLTTIHSDSSAVRKELIKTLVVYCNVSNYSIARSHSSIFLTSSSPFQQTETKRVR